MITDTTGSGLGGEIIWAYSVDAVAVEYIALGETRIESFQVTLDDHHGGTVSINANNTLTYMPAANFSGLDIFSYTVMDNNGATDTATVEVSVEAVADEPVITSTVSAGSSVYEVALDIALSSDDSDGSESYSYSLSGIPANAAVVDNGLGDIVLTLPSDVDTDFDLLVSATSTEASNGSTADSSKGIRINLNVAENDFRQSFGAENQNMWGQGPAFTIQDHRFLGLDISLSDASADAGVSIPIPSDIPIPHMKCTVW